MTRRERIEARLERRRQWKESAEAKSAQHFKTAHQIVESIPLGQPILVGHHSEKRHRRALDSMASHMDRACERDKMAKEHNSKAGNIEHALETSIYSDDPDAIEAIEARIASLEAQREEKRQLGAAWRKAKKPKSTDIEGWKRVCDILGWAWGHGPIMRGMRDCAREEGFCNRGPVPPYVLSNLGGNVSRLRKRLVEIKRQQDRAKETEEAGGFRIARSTQGDYCNVQFSDKPERAIIDALKAARFHWSGGMWCGSTSALPTCVLEMESKDVPT